MNDVFEFVPGSLCVPVYSASQKQGQNLKYDFLNLKAGLILYSTFLSPLSFATSFGVRAVIICPVQIF